MSAASPTDLLVRGAKQNLGKPQRLTLAQQRQLELEKRIAHAQESRLKRANSYLLDVWRTEIIRWKNVEQAADRELRDLD